MKFHENSACLESLEPRSADRLWERTPDGWRRSPSRLWKLQRAQNVPDGRLGTADTPPIWAFHWLPSEAMLKMAFPTMYGRYRLQGPDDTARPWDPFGKLGAHDSYSRHSEMAQMPPDWALRRPVLAARDPTEWVPEPRSSKPATKDSPNPENALFAQNVNLMIELILESGGRSLKEIAGLKVGTDTLRRARKGTHRTQPANRRLIIERCAVFLGCDCHDIDLSKTRFTVEEIKRRSTKETAHQTGRSSS